MGTASEVIARHLRLWESLPAMGEGLDRAALEAWGRAHEVTYRQIQRDLAGLESEGCVLGSLYGKGKRWRRTTQRPGARSLSREQAFVLHAVQTQLGQLLPPQLLHMLQPLCDEASILLQRPEYKTERTWFERIRVVPGLLHAPLVLDGVLPTVIEALLEEKWLQLDYENAAHQEKSGKVMSLGLVKDAQLYYLVCRFEGYTDSRHIRVDRIIRAEKLDTSFQYPKEFSLSEHIDSGAFELSMGDTVMLRMIMHNDSHQHLLDRPLSRDQQISQPDAEGRVVVQATVQNSQRLYWWILGFGSNVEVIEPACLRAELKEEFEVLHQRYAG